MERYLWIVDVVIGVLVIHRLTSIAGSLGRTEAMIKRLLADRGVDWEAAAEPSDRVKSLARAHGKEIEAIKAYREQTGLGLKEARAVIDRLRDEVKDASSDSDSR